MGKKLFGAPDPRIAGRCNIYAIGHFSGPGIWMDDALGHEITQLLQAWRRGDEGALDKLTPQVYRELHLVAGRCMRREPDGHTLQTTALINELYLRLSDLKLIDWQDRAHFFALCARQMRRILTDHARARRSHKRGDGAKAISLEIALQFSPQPSAVLAALDAL